MPEMQFFQKIKKLPDPNPPQKNTSLSVKYVSEKEWSNHPKEIRVE